MKLRNFLLILNSIFIFSAINIYAMEKKPTFSSINQLEEFFSVQHLNQNTIVAAHEKFETWRKSIPDDFRNLVAQEVVNSVRTYIKNTGFFEIVHFFYCLPEKGLLKTTIRFIYFEEKNIRLDSVNITEIASLVQHCKRVNWETLWFKKDFQKYIESHNSLRYIREPSKLRNYLEYILEIIEPLYGVNVKDLHLCCNDLKEIPETIFALKNLEELCLSENRLETIPKSIGKLTKLRKLDLKNNNLKRLPEELINLDNLKLLDISKNSHLVLDIQTLVIIKKLEYKGIEIIHKG